MRHVCLQRAQLTATYLTPARSRFTRFITTRRCFCSGVSGLRVLNVPSDPCSSSSSSSSRAGSSGAMLSSIAYCTQHPLLHCNNDLWRHSSSPAPTAAASKLQDVDCYSRAIIHVPMYSHSIDCASLLSADKAAYTDLLPACDTWQHVSCQVTHC